MATTTLIVVIIVLLGNLGILYLPFDKKKKAVLSLISTAVLVICALSCNAQKNEIPVMMREKIAKAENQQGQKAMMATFNLSEEKLNTKEDNPTPIEIGVSVVLVFALVFTPLLIYVVKDQDEKTTKKVHQKALILNALAVLLVLSLYYGLKLTIVPWIKKSQRDKTLRDIKKAHLALC